MYLIRVFSHDPLTGISKTKTGMIPDGIIPNKIYSAISARIQRIVVVKKIPMELGFTYDPNKYYAKEIYAKPLLMAPEAKITAVLNMISKGIIKKEEAMSYLDYEDVLALSFSHVVKNRMSKVLSIGEGGYPGAITGNIVFTKDDLNKFDHPIWVLENITNKETKYFSRAKGLILTKSGATSHGAILSRNLGIPCIFGAQNLLDKKYKFKLVTLDGKTGEVFEGQEKIELKHNEDLIKKIESLCKSRQYFKVMVNAENPAEISAGLIEGAKGVGLCRTEHMFMSDERLKCIQDILFNAKPTQTNMDALMKYQQDDFSSIFEVLGKREIVIRYLDAPLHEFGGRSEENPMLGFRGARMLLLKPDIIRVQTRAIFSALRKIKDNSKKPKIILELPLVSSIEEVIRFKQIVNEVILKEYPKAIKPLFGAMIETPAAAFLAGKISKEVDHLSFGSNDLTQMTLGLSRDDTKELIRNYVSQKLFRTDPFVSIDRDSVLELMLIAVKRARKLKPCITISVCGEQAGDPVSLKLLKKIGIKNVSVSQSKVKKTVFWSAKNAIID